MKLFNTIIIGLTLLLSISSYGQVNNSSNDSIISEINKYVQRIDSNESLAQGITEGVIKYDGKTGGFETYNLFDPNTQELYRIQHNEATNEILNLTFYYKDMQLIYAVAKKRYWHKNKYIADFKKEVYFDSGKVVHETGDGIESYELQSIGLSHYQSQSED